MDKVRQRARHMRESVTRGTLLCMAALALALATGWLMNAGIYARIAPFYGIAREINTFFTAGLFLVLFLVAMRKPRLLDRRIMLAVSLGCLASSVFILVMAIRFEVPAFVVVGLAFRSIGSSWAIAMVACALGSLPSRMSALVAIAGGYALSELAQLVLPPPSFEGGIVGVAVCSGAALLLVNRVGAHVLDEVAQGQPVELLQLANPESFLVPTHALFVCALLFSVASGYALTLNEVAHAPISSDVVALVVTGVAVWMLFSTDDTREDSLFSFALLLVVAGYLMAPFTMMTGLPSANAVLRVGIDVFGMLLWMVIVAVCRQNVFALLPTFALLRCVQSLGTNIGAISGHVSNDLVGSNAQVAAPIAALATFVFIAFMWVGFRKFSFTETIRGVATVAASSSEVAVNRLDDACVLLGERYSLTSRETEILAMLARGRDGQFVIDHFVISRNTMKTHVKHIYQKLGIHSRQELIDVVEAAAGEEAV